MGISEKTLIDNAKYWDERAATYSDVNKWELAGESRQLWKDVCGTAITSRYPNKKASEISVLDVACGPGFLSFVLTELGYKVTAIDFSRNMLAEAKLNAGELADKITFTCGNAEALEFEDDSFDVVISRNLTWNLPHPDKAYSEWCRVLKPGGILINFDANWYHYLYDEEKRAKYEADRRKSAELGLDDQNIGDNFDLMEDIALEMPLSRIERPGWDIGFLSGLGMNAVADKDIWRKVWTEQEKINFSSTPLFMITAAK